MNTAQRDELYRLLLLCCPIVQLSLYSCIPSLHLTDGLPNDTLMQLAAVPKLLPPPEMARGIRFIAARKVQGRNRARLGQ